MLSTATVDVPLRDSTSFSVRHTRSLGLLVLAEGEASLNTLQTRPISAFLRRWLWSLPCLVVFYLLYLASFTLFTRSVLNVTVAGRLAVDRTIYLDFVGVAFLWRNNLATWSVALCSVFVLYSWLSHWNVTQGISWLDEPMYICGRKWWNGMPKQWVAGKKRLVPKSAADILLDLFKGHPSGTPFVSYCWSDTDGEPSFELPRRVARYMEARWLDVERLIPGAAITATCQKHAQEAPLRIVFLSQPYLRSKNCKTEWAVIRPEPNLCLIFASCDDQFSVMSDDEELEGSPKNMRSELASLTELGHEVIFYKCPEEITAEYLLRLLITRGHAKRLLKICSPAINENWLPTVACMLGRRGTKFMIAMKMALALIMLSAAQPALAYWVPKNEFSSNGVGSVSAIVCWLAMACGYVVMAGQIWSGDDLLERMPDIAHVLIVLRLLGVTSTLPVFVDQHSFDIEGFKRTRAEKAQRGVKSLCEAVLSFGPFGVIKGCLSPAKSESEVTEAAISMLADLDVISLEESFESRDSFAEGGLRVVHALKVGEDCSLRAGDVLWVDDADIDKLDWKRFSDLLISTSGKPGLDQLLCLILSQAIQCPVADFCVGSSSFPHTSTGVKAN